jgi:glyoxylase-like metal-dependent hydrolase (beta-lactamase superfamily II)
VPAARVRHLNCAAPPRGALRRRGETVCHCLLVETARDGLVLVDAGVGAVAPRQGRLPFAAPAAPGAPGAARRQVEALGHSAADVRHVVVTHLDRRHAGGLPDFPRAAVHVLAAEHRAATAPETFLERRRYRRAHFAHGPRWVLHEAAGEPWRGFACARPLPGLGPEVLLLPLAGHTRGHAAVAVESASGWLLHAGDAYAHRGSLRPDDGAPVPPAVTAYERAVAADWAGAFRNHARLRALAARDDPGLTVFCSHDPVEYARALAAETH